MRSALHIAFIEPRYLLFRTDHPDHSDIHVRPPGKALALVARAPVRTPLDRLTFFAGQDPEQELLTFNRQAGSFTGKDLVAETEIGAVRFGSVIEPREEPWQLVDADGREIARLVHLSGRGPASRIFARWLPERFALEHAALSGLTLRRASGVRGYRLDLDLRADPLRELDRRLSLGAAALLACLDRREAQGIAGEVL